MLELTMISLVVALVIYVLHLLTKRMELDTMSVIMGVIALAAVLRDTEIAEDDLIFYIIPTFYVIATSALSLAFEWGIKNDKKRS